MRKTSLFPDAITPAYGYSEDYYVADTLIIGKGYWLKFPQSDSVSIVGRKSPTDSLFLSAGWNLIGPFDYPVNTDQISTIPPEIIISSFFKYDKGYKTTNQLKPGKGYWVKLSAQGILILDTVVTKFSKQIEKTYSDSFTITISDNGGNSTELYLIKNNKSANCEMPPKPPAGIFDARFVTDKNAESYNQEFKTIEFSSDSYPVTITLDGFNAEVVDCINGELIRQDLKSGDKLIISDKNISMIKIRPVSIVYNFELFQNFPNPFNPVTTIKFSLPEKLNVKLSIYDVLGRKIKELIKDEIFEAGLHTVVFDGSQLTSGIYLYKIDAGNYSEVKKLILLK